MRTNIEIDDELMQKAMKASGASTKKAVVEEGLLMLVRRKERLEAQAAALRGLRGIDHDGKMFYEDYAKEIRSRGEPR